MVYATVEEVEAGFRTLSDDEKTLCSALLAEAGAAGALVQVDGGACPENAAALLDAGADVLVSGSAFFGHKPYDARLAAFMKAAEGRAVRPGLRAARAWRHAAPNANP